jgi:formylglycine-generating enzyme required for sulfatase activity
MAAKPNPQGGAPLVRLEADEFARLKAEEPLSLEQQWRAEREGQSEREVVERAWREEQEYARAVAELKEETARRRSRRAPAIAVALFLAVMLGAVVYFFPRAPEQLLRLEPISAAPPVDEPKAAVEAPVQPAAESTPVPRVAADARKPAAADKAKSLKADDEARRRAAQAALQQVEAMTRAEERARAETPRVVVKEAPRVPLRPGTVFQDCPECPRMVVVPAGDFTMGSPASEAGRAFDEGPQRLVTIAQPFALGRNEVTVAEFRRFADETGYKTEAEREGRAQGCSGFIYADPVGGNPAPLGVTSWRSPGLAQADSHPVLCVSWNDARAYAQWLSKKTAKRYRLPSEAEWEYAARAGASAARHWGEDPVQACRYANVADQSRFQTWGFGQKHECTDGHYFTAPAGGYLPNRFGLHDMLGNVWEWTEDCWNASYAGAPSDGSAWLAGDCAQRVCRGGSWSTVPRFARSATRNKNTADHRDNLTGFRLARTLE